MLVRKHERVHFTGLLSYEEASGALGKASVVVSPRISGTNTPLKIYQLLASGIPIVATDIESHTQVLDETVAFLGQPIADAFAATIIAALTQPADAAARAARAQHLYQTHYSRASYTAKMRRALTLAAH